MRIRNVPVLALFAVVHSPIAIAAPSPAHDQQQRFLSSTDFPSPSYFRTITNTLLDKIWGLGSENGERRSKHLPKPTWKQSPSAHFLAQYGEDVVLRFNVTTAEEVESLAEAADTLLLDIWEYSQDWVDIRLSKTILPALLDLLPSSMHKAHVPLMQEKELAQAVQDTYPSRGPKSQPPPSDEASRFSPARALDPPSHSAKHDAGENYFFADYQPLSVIQPWMRLLSSLFTTHVRHISIGTSYEGRDIPALRVGNHPTNTQDPNPVKRKTILIIGGLHAREWISTSTVNYIAYSLITGYGKKQAVTSLLEAFDFVFVPTLNPDGYVYTWETDRLWRKTRQRTGVRFCPGIDLDHAFDFEWSTTYNQCSESYAGDEPFQAVEAQRLAEWARNETQENNVEFVGFLDLHSYSQQILYPYSYSCSHSPPGLENLEELAIGLGKAIRTTSHHDYDVLSACEGNYAGTGRWRHLLPHVEQNGGSALDYFYHNVSTRFSYQIKLRDLGSYGFLLPKDQILPTGKEILSAVMYFGDFMMEKYYGLTGTGSGPVPVFERMKDEVLPHEAL